MFCDCFCHFNEFLVQQTIKILSMSLCSVLYNYEGVSSRCGWKDEIKMREKNKKEKQKKKNIDNPFFLALFNRPNNNTIFSS